METAGHVAEPSGSAADVRPSRVARRVRCGVGGFRRLDRVSISPVSQCPEAERPRRPGPQSARTSTSRSRATRSSSSPACRAPASRSLAFDTIFAEGQRRYVESLSAYARQFLGQVDRPDVDFIEGLSPAVSIDQKSTNRNPRSTVGTITEIYDYMRLLWARIGDPHCPVCGETIQRQTVQQIADQLMELETGTRYQVLAPVVSQKKGEFVDLFKELAAGGYSRALVDGETHPAHRAARSSRSSIKHDISVVVDRLVAADDLLTRLTDSLETALAAHRRPGHDQLRRRRRGPAPAHLQREAVLPERPPDPAHRDRAAHLLVQRAVRRLPGVLRASAPRWRSTPTCCSATRA